MFTLMYIISNMDDRDPLKKYIYMILYSMAGMKLDGTNA